MSDDGATAINPSAGPHAKTKHNESRLQGSRRRPSTRRPLPKNTLLQARPNLCKKPSLTVGRAKQLKSGATRPANKSTRSARRQIKATGSRGREVYGTLRRPRRLGNSRPPRRFSSSAGRGDSPRRLFARASLANEVGRYGVDCPSLLELAIRNLGCTARQQRTHAPARQTRTAGVSGLC